MGRKASNHILRQAKKAKSDEFYTQLCDIERELQHYDMQFRGKIVYCNCDDPHISNFVKYFIDNFHKLGLKKLIASCYQESTVDLFHPLSIGNGFYCEYFGNNKPIEINRQILLLLIRLFLFSENLLHKLLNMKRVF